MEKEIIEEKSKLNQEERKKEPKIINILFWIACFYFLIETIFCIIRIKYGNIPQLITYSLATISICPLFSKLLNLKKKINYNWIIQILVTIIIIFIGQFFFNFDSWHFNLTKKIDTENFSYYVSEEWRTKEEVKDNTKTEYYYPYNSNGEGFIMVSTEKNDNYSLKQKIDYDFVNNFIQGMGLKSNDIIRVKMDKINNNDCEIIDSYYNINNNRYEILIYIWINNNFCNTFSICQTEKIHSDFKKELEEILQNVSTKNISFDDSSLKMKINETKNIHVNYSPSDFKEDIIWTSSNEKIANVENGTISAISAGKATITATTSSGITRKILYTN